MGDFMDLNFDSIYNLFKLIFKPLSNLLNIVKVNGTSLLVILVTLFLLFLLLKFILRSSGGGTTGIIRSSKTHKGGD